MVALNRKLRLTHCHLWLINQQQMGSQLTDPVYQGGNGIATLKLAQEECLEFR